jgi:ketosteroid isomerase-like protein
VTLTPCGNRSEVAHEQPSRRELERAVTQRVTLPEAFLDDLALTGVDPERIVRETIDFLLDREPATAILPEFSLEDVRALPGGPAQCPEYPYHGSGRQRRPQWRADVAEFRGRPMTSEHDSDRDAPGRGQPEASALPTMLRTFCDAVEQRNGAALAALFTDDGVYHDLFYGAFRGRARIAELIDDWFHRDATEFRWDMHDPVSDGTTLYVRYTFSWRSLLPEAEGARAMFEGVAIMRTRDGLIAEYREVANTGPAFVDMNFPPERIVTILERQGAALRARPEMARHLA